MTLRTVTVCPDCKYVFIVKKTPETTACGRCRSRHTFTELKHYYQSEDAEAARKVRAKVQASVQDLGEDYDRAKERGVLEAEVEQAITDDEYLDQHGVDPEEVADAEERATEGPAHDKSKKDIVLDAVREQDQPDRDDVAEYARQYGMDPDRALTMLDKFRQNGDVGGNHNGPFRVY